MNFGDRYVCANDLCGWIRSSTCGTYRVSVCKSVAIVLVYWRRLFRLKFLIVVYRKMVLSQKRLLYRERSLRIGQYFRHREKYNILKQEPLMNENFFCYYENLFWELLEMSIQPYVISNRSRSLFQAIFRTSCMQIYVFIWSYIFIISASRFTSVHHNRTCMHFRKSRNIIYFFRLEHILRKAIFVYPKWRKE